MLMGKKEGSLCLSPLLLVMVAYQGQGERDLCLSYSLQAWVELSEVWWELEESGFYLSRKKDPLDQVQRLIMPTFFHLDEDRPPAYYFLYYRGL